MDLFTIIALDNGDLVRPELKILIIRWQQAVSWYKWQELNLGL